MRRIVVVSGLAAVALGGGMASAAAFVGAPSHPQPQAPSAVSDRLDCPRPYRATELTVNGREILTCAKRDDGRPTKTGSTVTVTRTSTATAPTATVTVTKTAPTVTVTTTTTATVTRTTR